MVSGKKKKRKRRVPEKRKREIKGSYQEKKRGRKY